MSYNDSKITRYEQEYIKNTNAIVKNSPVTCDDMVSQYLRSSFLDLSSCCQNESFKAASTPCMDNEHNQFLINVKTFCRL